MKKLCFFFFFNFALGIFTEKEGSKDLNSWPNKFRNGKLIFIFLNCSKKSSLKFEISHSKTTPVNVKNVQ